MCLYWAISYWTVFGLDIFLNQIFFFFYDFQTKTEEESDLRRQQQQYTMTLKESTHGINQKLIQRNKTLDV